MFGSGFKVEKFKPYLKMSLQRILLLKQKKSIHIKKDKRVVAELLKEGKEEKARIKTESIVRADFTIEALEIIELLCELMLERVRLIVAEKECPFDMREAVCTLIYAANRTEVKELTDVSKQLQKKYGKEFADIARSNSDNSVNERVVHKLSAQPPNAFLVLNYMKEIAKTHKLDWTPDESVAELGMRFDAPMMSPNGATVSAGSASGVSDPYRYTDGRITRPGEAPTPGNMMGGAGAGAAAGAGPPSAPSGKSMDSSKRSSKSRGHGKGGDGSSRGSRGGGSGGQASPSATAAGYLGDNSASSMGLPVSPSSKGGSRGGESESGGGGGGSAAPTSDSGAVPDFDELSKRFAALKGRS